MLKDIPPLLTPRKGSKSSKTDTQAGNERVLPDQNRLNKTERKEDRRKDERRSSEEKSKPVPSDKQGGANPSTSSSSSRHRPVQSAVAATEPKNAKEVPDKDKVHRSSNQTEKRSHPDHKPSSTLVKESSKNNNKGAKDAAVAGVRDLLPKGFDKANSITNSLKEGAHSSSPKERANRGGEEAKLQVARQQPPSSSTTENKRTTSSAKTIELPKDRTLSKATRNLSGQPTVKNATSDKTEDKPRRGNKVVANFRLSVEQAARSVQQGGMRARENGTARRFLFFFFNKRSLSPHETIMPDPNEVALRSHRPKETARRSEKGSNTQFLVTL